MIFSNILIYFVVIPLLMLGLLFLCRNMKQIRTVAVIGSTALLALSVYLIVDFLELRAAGNTDIMLYQASWMWFEPLNIHLAVGVDGISVAMILLSSIIVFAGTFRFMENNPASKGFFPVAYTSVYRCVRLLYQYRPLYDVLCSMKWRLYLCTFLSAFGEPDAKSIRL